MRGRPLVATACALAVWSTTPLPSARAAVPVLVIDGKGFGHGVGMAQDGAFWMGKSGATTPAILNQFYPGTKNGKAGGPVRIVVHAPTDGQAVVQFPNGGEIRDALDGGQSPGFPVRVAAGGQVRLRFDGARYSVEGGSASAQSSAESSAPAFSSRSASSTASRRDENGEEATAQQVPIPSTTTTSSTTTSTTAPPAESTTTTSTTAPPPPKASGPSSARTLWAVPSGGGTTNLPVRGRRYRGVIEATAARGPFRLVNQVDVEVYLRGMGEVRDPSWPAASLRAQAVAARTYALRAMRANGELCDDQRCQVYLGAQAEYGAMDKAVKDTSGQVLTFGSTLASTVYSANGGAHSASRHEGFGTPDDTTYPYLRPAPYPTQNPLPWTVKVGLADVAARLGYRGALSSVAVGRTGPSGRAVEVVLDGAAGPKTVTGIAFARAFSLKSTLFALKSDTAEAAPAPPPAGDALQVLPEDAGPTFDPNALPPDPLTPDEFLPAVPPPDAFTPMPTAEFEPAAGGQARSALPWGGLAGFLLIAVGAGGGLLWYLRQQAARPYG